MGENVCKQSNIALISKYIQIAHEAQYKKKKKSKNGQKI